MSIEFQRLPARGRQGRGKGTLRAPHSLLLWSPTSWWWVQNLPLRWLRPIFTSCCSFFLKRGFLKSSNGGTDFSLTAHEFSLMIRECCILWDLILVNMHNLDVYSKDSNLISLWDSYDSYKKVDKLLMVEEQSGCTVFNELNFNSTFRWFRAIQFRSQIAHGIIWWLLLLSSLSSSISLALSSFQLDSKLSRAGTMSCVILCNS